MVSDLYNLKACLLRFENALRIEYTESEVADVLESAKRRLEDTYQCRLDKPIYSAMITNDLVQGNLETLVNEVAQCYQMLCAVNGRTLYTKEPVVVLADVNYLGFTSETLCTSLKYFQDRVLYNKRSSLVTPITIALDNVGMCDIKRLFIIMLLLERLGFEDVVAACAQTLYLGGLTL